VSVNSIPPSSLPSALQSMSLFDFHVVSLKVAVQERLLVIDVQQDPMGSNVAISGKDNGDSSFGRSLKPASQHSFISVNQESQRPLTEAFLQRLGDEHSSHWRPPDCV